MSSSDQEYEVHSILDKKITIDRQGNSHIYYLVHWKGYSQKQATWEPIDNLENAMDKVKDFDRTRWNTKLNIRTSKQDPQDRKKYQTCIIDEQPIHVNAIPNENINMKSQKERKTNDKPEYKIGLRKYKNKKPKQQLDRSQNFTIIGAKKPETILFVQTDKGRIFAVKYSTIMQNNPLKLIEFYEKHVKANGGIEIL